MGPVGRVGMLMAALVLSTGCTRMVDGTVVPAQGLAPRPLTGQTVEKVLPDVDELSEILGQLKPDEYLAPISGGIEELPDGLATEADASPHACVGVVASMQRSTYESAGVTDVAIEHWEGDEPGGAVLAAEAGVLALPSVADANALFDEFARQWQDCEGRTVTLVKGEVRGGFFTDTITQVRAEGSVLAADVEFGHTIEGPSSPVSRALGVRANCLVEVEVTFYGNPSGRSPGKADTESSAIDIARLMMDRISELS